MAVLNKVLLYTMHDWSVELLATKGTGPEASVVFLFVWKLSSVDLWLRLKVDSKHSLWPVISAY